MAAPPRPKSPPASPDPCGRHRLQHAVDALHREIGFLEGEINSVEGVHAASKCCKEEAKYIANERHHELQFEALIDVTLMAITCSYTRVDEFIGRNTDPFITISSEKPNTDQSHYFLKKFRAMTCLSYLWGICCCGGCSASSQLKRPRCSCAGALQRLHSTGSCCRRRVRCACCCSSCGCTCPRCSCSACPRCAATCCVPRCCPCPCV